MEGSAPRRPPLLLPPSSSLDGSHEPQCVGKMEIVRPKSVGFLCGSIPVPTDNSFHGFNSALVPSCERVSAPRYRMLPMETDLNRPPLLANLAEKVLPLASVQSNGGASDLSWEANAIASNLSRKGEALAVSGLVEYGDEIHVIAPVDILKQIFKIPYSKARVSITVQRVGQTLVLNSGPDPEEGEKLIRRHNNQPKCHNHADDSLFLNFAMHSVRMEACDCPPTHRPQYEGLSSSSALPGNDNSQTVQQKCNFSQDDGINKAAEYNKQVKQDEFCLENNKSKKTKVGEPVKKPSHISEKSKSAVQESDKQRRGGDNGFLRVLFWQFHNFRMLLGSDLLLFSNEKYFAVSLHLWDVSRQVTPLTWLDAWLDNVMASVPELAICYHQDGVVQGYELLKTDDIFLLKGVSEDGSPAFHPHVVQQNGHSVLKFLQGNCKQDPGAYWLYKSAGEDVIQLFDLSIIPKNHSSNDREDTTSNLPSLNRTGRNDSLFSLGSLLYRVGHRLSLSMASSDRTKCVAFLRKCLDFLDEPHHLVVRAFAHEQFARLILTYDEELDLSTETFYVDGKVTVTDVEEPLNPFTTDHENDAALVIEDLSSGDDVTPDMVPSSSIYANMTLEANMPPPRKLIAPSDEEFEVIESTPANPSDNSNLAICPTSPSYTPLLQSITDPISSKLAAIHHVSQAIKSLRWTRQLQHSEQELIDKNSAFHNVLSSSINFSVCACGDPDCIEVCDIREWLPTSKLDSRLWRLVLLLGESFLSLGEAYKEDGQLHQALKTVELACSIYGSMPKKREETRFISSIITKMVDNTKEGESISSGLTVEQLSSTYVFWAKAWMLVGDIYVEFHIIRGKESSKQVDRKLSDSQLRMSSEVVKEVQRLKRKLAQDSPNCSSCSLVNCSCQSDRASSGSSASSSSSNTRSGIFSKKNGRKSQSRSVSNTPLRPHEDVNAHQKAMDRHSIGRQQFECGGDNEAPTNNFGVGTVGISKSQNTNPLNQSEANSKKKSGGKNGGIFKYLAGPLVGDAENNLLNALSCYKDARKALVGFPTGSDELQSLLKKKGWVCNELGRNRLERKELSKAEDAFADAIKAFKEVSDHTNVILINCNLGHGRRALAEEMVSKVESLKMVTALQNAYRQALETAKLEYGKSLRYYVAAKSELDSAIDKVDSVSENLRNEVYTQLAHTYLRLGMLLAKEDTTAPVFENGATEDLRKHEISANEAIRDALALYESLGELRKQEAAYAHFQLACYQRDCCLRFMEMKQNGKSPKTKDNAVQRAKQYASLAERYWQKSMDFYGSETHPIMHLTVLMERAALLFSLSNFLHSTAMIDSALSRLLEGRHVSETFVDSLRADYPELYSKFWSQLQMVLKKMLSLSLPAAAGNKSSQTSVAPNRTGDAGKLRQLYKMSLKPTGLGELHSMHSIWTS